LIATLALPVGANATLYVFETALNGAQETPPVASPGVGTAIFTFDDVANSFNLTLAGLGLTSEVTAAHFHKGAVGQPGPIVRDLGIPASVAQGSGFAFNALYFNQALGPQLSLADFLASTIYVNVHTALHPTGEIRGQFGQLVPIPEPGTWLLVAAGLVVLAGSALRRRMS
jgi:hypothetical protein